MASDLPRTIRALLLRAPEVSATEVARAAGVSRQAAHAQLRRLVETGELSKIGAARATRYRRAPSQAQAPRLAYPSAGLEEHRVWADASRQLPELSPEAEEIAAYAVTELVNNAIDHAAAQRIELSLDVTPEQLTIEVSDDGIGVFEHLRARLGLASYLQAVEELHKGKVTTMPERHSGEGIYFVSKAVDRFTLESSGLCWIVDNALSDMAVLEVEAAPGTRAEVALSRAPMRTLSQVFGEYTDDFEFSKTKTVVKLFAIGVRFVSRSEAKRLVHGLEKFREVVLDFAGVAGIGQGFADEVFRVWARVHPDTRLVPINMNGAVELMVRRANA